MSSAPVTIANPSTLAGGSLAFSHTQALVPPSIGGAVGVEGASELPVSTSGEQVAFVDSSLAHIDTLIDSLSQATVYLIGAEDGVGYISDVLSEYQTGGQRDGQSIGGIHIFAHGRSGALQLGNTTLNSQNLTSYSDELAMWSESHTNDVLLYACNVAEGPTGNAFIDQLATMTGADIQASNDLTGSAALGGDWDLELSTGSIETGLVISAEGQASYEGTLALRIARRRNLSVDENTTFVTDLRVRGARGGFSEGNGVEYYFSGGNDSYLFDLDTNTGVLSFKESPDFERPADANRDNRYDVGVLAIDYTGQSVTKRFRVKVKDVEDNVPELAISSDGGDAFATVAVDEGTTAVTDINVTGALNGFTEGNGVEYYFFGGQDSYLFDLDTHTGELSFTEAPDFDNPIDADRDNSYDVKILAIDYTGQQATQTIAVEVNDVVSQAPVITSNGGNDTAVINVDENTTAVTDVNASAANGASEGNGFTYSINAGADADLFNIDPVTGVVSFKAAPDFENPADADGNNVYFANVLVQDPTGAADSQFISVVVKNITETNNDPVITSSGGGDTAFIQVEENTRRVVNMQSTDADGDTEGNGITYVINDGEDADLFRINRNSGVISFKAAPDFENPNDHDSNNIYRINVLALDSQGGADSQFIQIEVTNKVAVYLLGGQSNMAGETSNAADLAGTPLASPLPDVKIWQPGFNAFEALRPGFDSNFGTGTGFGAELGFGHALEAARDNGSFDSEEIYIVKYAVGATSLAEDWAVNGGPVYANFNSWVGGALANLEAAGIGFEIEAMLWMQGENDAIDASRANSYQANLTDFIADVRDRYNSNMDFLIGRLHEELTPNFYTDAQTVRSAQVAVADTDPNNYWIDTDDFVVNPVDGVHFDSSGHLALGEAFADVLLG